MPMEQEEAEAGWKTVDDGKGSCSDGRPPDSLCPVATAQCLWPSSLPSSLPVVVASTSLPLEELSLSSLELAVEAVRRGERGGRGWDGLRGRQQRTGEERTNTSSEQQSRRKKGASVGVTATLLLSRVGHFFRT